MSRYYQRLTEVADLPYDDRAEQEKYTQIQTLIAESRTLAQQFRQEPGMTGEAATAALAWLAEYESDLSAQATALETVMTRHNLARKAMSTAAVEHQGLAAQLMTPWESRFLAANGPYVVDGVEVAGSTYAARLRHERDVERENKAEQILRTMNEAVREQGDRIRDPLPVEADGPGSDGQGSGAGSGSGSRTGGSSSGRGRGSSDPYAGIDVPSPSAPGSDPSTGSDPSGPSTPVTIPRSPHTPITIPNGPTSGTTYPPPSVTEPDDPRWSEHYQPIGSGSTAGAVGIVGGVLGVGAVAASRALGAGLTGSAGLAFGAGPGSAGALGGTGYGGLGGYGATAGRAPAGGMLGGQGNQAGTAAAAAAGSAAGRGTAGRAAGGRGAAPGAGGAGAAGRDGRKDKRRHRLVGYQVDRLEDDGPLAPVDSEAAAAGTSDRLGPLPDVDAGDRW